jgi:hypothetical protein
MSYPHVTQFETRDLRIADELRLRRERQPRTRRSSGARSRLAAVVAAVRRSPAALSDAR